MIHHNLRVKTIFSVTLLAIIFHSSAQSAASQSSIYHKPSTQNSSSTSPAVVPTKSPQTCDIVPVNNNEETIRRTFTPQTLATLYRSKSTDDLAANAEKYNGFMACKKGTNTPIAATLDYRTGNEVWVDAISVDPLATETDITAAIRGLFKQIRIAHPNQPLSMCLTESHTQLYSRMLGLLATQGCKQLYQSVRMIKTAQSTHEALSNLQRKAFLRRTHPSATIEENSVIQKHACAIYTNPALLSFYGCTAEQVVRYPWHATRTTLTAYLTSTSDIPVGALTFNQRNPSRYHFELAGVPPEHQKTGIATQLYLAAEQIAYEANPFAEIEINTYATNTPVLTASAKAGFTREYETVKLRKSRASTPQPKKSRAVTPQPELPSPHPQSMPILQLPPSATTLQ